jgi:4a-hydroxytetrahydrobiopterin dehydratase
MDMAGEKLERAAIEEALKELDGWTLDAGGKSISRKFDFRNFSEAFAFMTCSALAAEKLNHHPDWSNVYKTVNVTLSTHDAGGLTGADLGLARHMNGFAAA